MKLKIPYGIADFQKINQLGYFYQDRTAKIPLIEQAGEQLLFLRPRRFGKSLLLSMLENYYDLNKADQFETLFGHLAIGQQPTPRHNQYFVMKWDFSTIAAHGRIEEIEQRIHEHLNGCIADFSVNYQHQLSINIERHADNALFSLRSLLTAIKQTPYQLYLFIDEYDNFANEVMMANKSHYGALLQGEGLLKTVFKNIKSAASGLGLDRVFITGVSPIVMSDMTSGYNVATNIYQSPAFNELCGFTEQEVRDLLNNILNEDEQCTRALTMMRTFYNGYRFHAKAQRSVYNPTLTLYFVRALIEEHDFPSNLLDENLAMDRNKLRYIAELAHGQEVIMQALADETPIMVEQLSERFGVEDMIKGTKDQTFMASLLYYFGMLTLQSGLSPLGKLRLTIPNLVARKLYLERLNESLLQADFTLRQQQDDATDALFLRADLQPLCHLIERCYFTKLSNRDYRWSNELTIKLAFMMLLYNDHLYMMVSETESGRRYVDLSLIVRPDMRQFQALDLVLEFKYLSLAKLGMSAEQLKAMDVDQLIALPLVAEAFTEAQQQGHVYMQTLAQQYPQAKLHGFSVVALGFEKLVFERFGLTDIDTARLSVHGGQPIR
jgi:hypothetical protein